MTDSSPTKKSPKQLRWERSRCSANFKLEKPRLYSGTACDRPETTKTPTLPPIPEVGGQQHSDTFVDQYNLNFINNDSTMQNTQEISNTTVASQTSPPKGNQPQNYVTATKQPPWNRIWNEPVPLLSFSNGCPTDIQESEQHVTNTLTRYNTIPLLSTTTPLIEEGLVRDEQTNELYIRLTSRVLLKRKEEIL